MIKSYIKIGVLFISLSFILSACSFPWEKDRTPIDPSQYNQDLEEDNNIDKVDVDTEDKDEGLRFSGELRKFTSISAIKDYLTRFQAPKVSLSYLSAESSYGVIGSIANKNLNDSSIFLDSSDMVKVNGNYAYVLERENIHVIQIMPSTEAAEVNKLTFTDRPLEIDISGNYLAVSGVQNQSPEGNSLSSDDKSYTFLKIYDISSPATPQEIKSLVFSGDYLGLRMHGNYVYFLSVTPLELASGKEILPNVYSSSKLLSETCSLNSECINSQVYYFDNNYDGHAFLSFTAVDLSSNIEVIKRQLYLVDDNYTLYISDSNNVYLAHKDYTTKEDLEAEIKREKLFSILSDEDKITVENIEKTSTSPYAINKNSDEIAVIINNYFQSLTQEEQTSWQKEIDQALKTKVKADSKILEVNDVYKFSLLSSKLSYDAKNQVSGRLLALNSFDEENGYLRLTTVRGELWPLLFSGDKKNYSNVYILDKDLNQVSALENLATDVEINNAAYMKSRVYLSTADSEKPIYVISLSNKSEPSILGALQVGSYSYYYPLDEDGEKLIAIGRQASVAKSGEDTEIKLSLFDFSDLQKPNELSSYIIGDSQSDSIALSDYRSLANILEKNIVSIPTSFKDGDALTFSGALIFSHNTEGELSLEYRVDHSAGGYFKVADNWRGLNYYDNTVLRSFVKDNSLFTVSNKYLKINNLTDGTEIASVALISSPEDSLINNEINEDFSGFISSEEAIVVAKKFLNEFFEEPQADVQSIGEEYGLYKLSINLESGVMNAYITKDGKLFFPDVINISNGTKITSSPEGEPIVENSDVIEIPIDDASLVAKNFVDEYLMTPGTESSILEISLNHEYLYKMKIDIGTGSPVDLYMTKDGKLFFPQVISVE